MADHGDRINNGNGPFRRYSPPPSPEHNRGQVTPLPRAAAGSPRVNRSARRRWRQWLQPPPPKTGVDGRSAPQPTSGSRGAPPSRSPEQRPVYRTPVPPSVQGQASPPVRPGSQTIPQPSAFVTGVSGAAPARQTAPSAPGDRRWGQPRSGTATAPRDRAPQGGDRRGSAAPVPGPVGTPGNKVTPLRRPPTAGSGSASLEGEGGSRPRPPARRRPAPRPVLYGVRLLILGVGLAAIAGTLLSALNPQQQGSPANNSPAAPESATPVVAAQRQPSRSAISPNNLTAGEDITYLETDLLELAGMAPGLTPSAFVLDLDTGRYVNLDGEAEIAAASTIKVPVLVAFFAAVDAGRITLDQAVTLNQEQIVGGSGDLQTDAVGTRYTAYDVATAMIINSDNTATEMIIDLLGGPAALNQTFQSWGLGSTILRNPLPDLEGTNTTSALDLVKLMALVEQGDLLSQRSRDRMLAIMQRTYARDLIPAGIDESAIVFNKTGDIGGLLGDVALVEAPNGKRYALAVLVQRPHNDGRAAELIRRMAETVHGEMNQPIAPVGGEPSPTDDTATPPLEEVAPNTASDVPQG